MAPSQPSIAIGHSPDPDDAFMFYGFASGQVTIPGYQIVHVLNDIQSLNVIAAGDAPLEVTAMSAHAYLELADRYQLLEVGTSVGRRYGPRVVARTTMALPELAGERVALPGPKTTATLVARRFIPGMIEVHTDFTKIMETVRSGEVTAGVIIHEGQLTFAEQGLILLADLGALFAEVYGGLPLPLGVNCVRRDLDPSLKSRIQQAYLDSIRVALAHRDAAVEYSLQFGRGLDKALADRFIGMYVNEDSLSFHGELRQAMKILRTDFWEAGHASA